MKFEAWGKLGASKNFTPKTCSRAGLVHNGKRAERQNGISFFSVFFGHLYTTFDRGEILHVLFSPFCDFLSHFWRSARSPLCTRPAQLQSKNSVPSSFFVWTVQLAKSYRSIWQILSKAQAPFVPRKFGIKSLL